MNQFTGPNVQSEAYMQNFMSLPPEMQSLSAQQQLPAQHQLMSQQPQVTKKKIMSKITLS